MSIWFTADLHLGHKAILKYAERPFADVEEMDARLVEHWNAAVGERDQVYLLGDVSFHRPERTRELLAGLNGRIHLIRGNHDKDKRLTPSVGGRFEWVKDLYDLKVQDGAAPDGVQRIVLCHYAMRVWNRSHHGSWHLYGHSHGSLADDPHSRSTDVGVDRWGYSPVSYETIRGYMANKTWRAVDHHGAE